MSAANRCVSAANKCVSAANTRMGSMRVLAIDQALDNSGWAFGSAGVCSACGLIKNPAGRFTDLGGRFLRFEIEVEKLIEIYQPQVISFESHRKHSGVQAAQVLGAVSAIVMKCAKARNIPSYGIEVGVHKKIFTGTARASKDLSLAVARKRYPNLIIPTDDVSDSIGILHATFDLLSK